MLEDNSSYGKEADSGQIVYRTSGNIGGELNLVVEAWTAKLTSADIIASEENGQLFGLAYC